MKLCIEGPQISDVRDGTTDDHRRLSKLLESAIGIYGLSTHTESNKTLLHDAADVAYNVQLLNLIKLLLCNTKILQAGLPASYYNSNCFCLCMHMYYYSS